MEQTNSDRFSYVVHGYSRQKALEAGLVFPTALTVAVWERYVQVPAGVEGQDEGGRLWDILTMCHFTRSRSTTLPNPGHFRLHVKNDNSDQVPPLVTLNVHCGPGDTAAPVLTIMLLGED
jgi:hypothetical protein